MQQNNIFEESVYVRWYINGVAICASLAQTVPDFRGWFGLAVEHYNRCPGNTGVRGSVWVGVEAVWSALQAGRQARLPAQHAVQPS